jgi:hypothetical protein
MDSFETIADLKQKLINMQLDELHEVAYKNICLKYDDIK